MAFPLQDAQCSQTAGDLVPLRPRSARLTATPAELILTAAHDLFHVGAPAIPATSLWGRPRQAVGGGGLLAVSDHPPLAPAAQPAALRPGGGPSVVPTRGARDPAVLLQTADAMPPRVPHPLQPRLRRIPGSTQPRRRATAQALARRAAPLHGPRRRRRAAATPTPEADRDAPEPRRPAQPHAGQPTDRFALRAERPPGEALERRRQRLGKPRVIAAERATRIGEARAPGQVQACCPRPIRRSHARQAVRGTGFEGLRQGHTTHGWAIIEPRGAVEPNPLWHRVLSCVMVGRELYALSPLLRNACMPPKGMQRWQASYSGGARF
jgi:hypothetical protein